MSIKNNITVYGAAAAPYPNDKDEWTDALTYWTENNGDLTLTNAEPYGVKAGSYRINCQSTDSYWDVTLALPIIINLRDINKLNFWYSVSGETPRVRLLAPDDSNYFSAALSTAGVWNWFDQLLGEANEYDADENPSGAWTKTGSPNWWNIQGIRLLSQAGTGTDVLYLDKLYFSPTRWVYTTSDATSISAYGQADGEFTDDNLLANSECQKRANTLLYQLKDPVIRADVTTPGNTNIKIGDRLLLTIPAEGLSAVSFDVVAVAHDWTMQGARTTASMVNSANVRVLPPASRDDVVARQIGNLKEVTSEIYQRIVR
jgi:hypothetical protein